MRMEARNNGVWLWLKVVPNASRTEIAGPLGDALKVKVMQPAEGGKANVAVEALIAGAVGVAAGRVKVVSGQTQQRKIIEITGATVDAVRAALAH